MRNRELAETRMMQVLLYIFSHSFLPIMLLAVFDYEHIRSSDH